MASVRLVCFDLGGVLVKICRSWAEGCRAAGLPVRGGSCGERAGRVRRELMQRFGTGRLSEAEWAEQLSVALDRLYTAAELERIHRAWTRREYAGIGDLIDALHAAGVGTACLSNTNHAHWVRLMHHDGAQALEGPPEYPSVLRLQHRYASHLLGVAKPSPAIYAEFERATACAADEILFFDDLKDNVAAARARGWNAERVDARRETAPQLRRALSRHGVL